MTWIKIGLRIFTRHCFKGMYAYNSFGDWHGFHFTHVLVDSNFFYKTTSFCLLFVPRVYSSREEAADGSSTHCRAEGAAVHSSEKRKRKKPGYFFIWNHFLNTVSLFDSWSSRVETVAFRDFSWSFRSLWNSILYLWSKFRPNRTASRLLLVTDQN